MIFVIRLILSLSQTTLYNKNYYRLLCYSQHPAYFFTCLATCAQSLVPALREGGAPAWRESYAPLLPLRRFNLSHVSYVSHFHLRFWVPSSRWRESRVKIGHEISRWKICKKRRKKDLIRIGNQLYIVFMLHCRQGDNRVAKFVVSSIFLRDDYNFTRRDAIYR